VVVEDFCRDPHAKSFGFVDFPRVVEEIWELLAVHHALVPDQAELPARSRAGRVRDQSRGCRSVRRGDVRVAKPQALLLVTAPLPGGIDTALIRKLRALIMSNLLNKFMILAPSFNLPSNRNGTSSMNSIRAKPRPRGYLPRGVGHLFNLLDRYAFMSMTSIEHARRRRIVPLEFLPSTPQRPAPLRFMCRARSMDPRLHDSYGKERLFSAISYHDSVPVHEWDCDSVKSNTSRSPRFRENEWVREIGWSMTRCAEPEDEPAFHPGMPDTVLERDLPSP